MGRRNILNNQRSLEKALSDLVERYRLLQDDDPHRPQLERMIDHLKAEIARRAARRG